MRIKALTTIIYVTLILNSQVFAIDRELVREIVRELERPRPEPNNNDPSEPNRNVRNNNNDRR